MTLSRSAGTPAAVSPGGGRRRLVGSSVRRDLLLGTAALVGLRLLLTLPRPGPVVLVDEIAYLTNARALAGGAPAELMNTPFYRGGYSLLIAPILGVFDDPVTAYHLTLVLNVVLAASLFPLLYLLLTRSFQVPSGVALWAAFAGAAYPSLTITTGAAMSENALLPLTVVWLLAFGAATETTGRARTLGAAVFGASAAALWAVHGRMAVAVGLAGLALVWLWLRRRLPAAAAAAGLACLGVGSLAATLLNDHLIDENFGGRDFDEAGSRLSDADSIDGALTVAGNLIGHTWYLLVATLGLAAFVWLVRDWRGPVLGLLLLTTLGLIAVSALSFSDIERPDMLVYGRYVELVAPPLVALGIAALVRIRGAAAVWPIVAGLLGLSVVVALLRHGLELSGAASFWNVQSLPLRSDLLRARDLALAGVAVCVVAWALVAVARHRPRALAPLVVLLFLPTTALGERSLLMRSRHVYPHGWQSIGTAVDGTGIRVVGYDDSHRDVDGQFLYPWFLTDAVMVSVPAGHQPPSRYVISSSAWPAAHPQAPARPFWSDPARDQVLWQLGP